MRLIRIATSICSLAITIPAIAQDGCSCPPPVPPVPTDPSCHAPSCVAPSAVYNGCAEGHCVQKIHTVSCSDEKCSSGKCCRPLINIDFSKKIIKKNGFGGGAMMGGVPPQGIAVSSMPVMPLNISAMPFTLGNAPSVGTSSVNEDQLKAIVAALREDAAGRASKAAAPASSDLDCEDPCGDIKQLQNDVAQIKAITRNLTRAVEKLAEEQAKREEGDSEKK